MKNRWFLILGLMVIIAIVITGCSSGTSSTPAAVPTEKSPTTTSPIATTSATTTNTTTTSTSSTATKTTTTTTSQPANGPFYGGTARVITSSGPKILGYSLEQGPLDLFVLLCGVEKVLEYNEKQELVPNIAESYKVDDTAKTISVTMRKGVKFHDGSECDADAIAWNYGQQVSNKRIGYLDQWDRLDVIDKYNFVIHYKGSFNNQMINGWLWSPPMFSKAAFEKAGNGDIEKSKDWARLNVSGTGPFKQGDFQRDVSLKMVRFDDYHGGKPYLDAIQYTFIPDPVTASLKLQAGEADLWFTVPIKYQVELQKQGMVRIPGQPSVLNLFPNIKKADSIWQNKDLREAVEYAIDKEGIAAAMGYGFYKGAKMVAPEGTWGFDPTYTDRSYNPDKAKQLLEKSGFKGKAIKLMVLTGDQVDTATAVKRYLDDIGLNCTVDIADPGRFYGSYYGTGWDDLLLAGFGVMGNALQAFHMNLGDQPLTRMGGWALPEGMVALSKESRTYQSENDQKNAAMKLFRGISDNAYIIPIYQFNSANMASPKFHTTLGQESGFTQYWQRYWLDQKK